MFEIKFTDNGVSEMLAKVRAEIESPLALMRSIAVEAANAVKANFRSLDATRSVYGHNFYTREGESKTTMEVDDTGATIYVMSRPMAHKLRGGEIRATNVKNLAIPISEKARREGRSPSLWSSPKLSLIRSKKGNRLLAATDSRTGTVEPHFYLTPRVNQRAFPETIPSKTELVAAVNRGIENANFLGKI